MAAESKEVLSGAVFEVHNEKGKVVVKVTTDKDGKAKITDLSVGNYTLVEVEAPKGYEKLTNPIPFEITNGMINAVQLEVLNKLNHLAPPAQKHQIQKTRNTRSRKTRNTRSRKTRNTRSRKARNTESRKARNTKSRKARNTESRKARNTESRKHRTPDPEKHRTPNPEKPEKLPKTGQKMPVEPYMGALLVMMSFGLLILGRKQQR